MKCPGSGVRGLFRIEGLVDLGGLGVDERRKLPKPTKPTPGCTSQLLASPEVASVQTLEKPTVLARGVEAKVARAEVQPVSR